MEHKTQTALNATVAGRVAGHLIPEDPRDAGVVPLELTIEEVEPAHLLANEERRELRSIGFTDDEIDDWAREFIAQCGGGDADDFVAWIRREEEGSSSPGDRGRRRDGG